VDWYKNATDADYAAVEEKFNREYKNNPKYFHDWRPEPLDLDPDRSVRYISQRPKIDQERKESAKPIADFGKENDVFVDSENPHLYMSNFYVNTINKAEKQILWGCHSNRPTPQVLAALKAAAKRGVEIFIVGNSPESARNLPDYGKLMYPLALCHYRDLLERDKDDKGSVRIFEWQKSVKRDGKTLTAGAFHSKVFSVDGVLTSVGSYNISRASYKQHTEGTFVFIDSEFSKTAEEMFQKDLSMS
jgi:phosphatidylserine/phosphatidylglycerophosphate/cardiolipin synthase-like enzyme